jgi:anionic cell wall polymer biosynthesis LytR-Cps2A-Psr (LCP) family protein
MSSLMRKMTSSSTLTSPARLYTLAATAAKAVTLSTSLASLDTMVSMLLAVKDIPTKQMVFVQYPTAPDPQNSNKVVPSTALADALFQKVAKDEPVRLAPSTRGYSTTVKAAAAASTPAPSKKAAGGSAKPAPALSGLSGQTADQQTCSVASGS